MITISVSENDANQRLDKFLKKYFRNAGLSHIYKIIRKDLKINGKRSTKDILLRVGDELTFYMSDEDLKYFTARPAETRAKRQFEIAYEDKNIVIVNKPYGLLTHGDLNEHKNHLANQVIDYLIESGSYNPRIEKTFVPAPSNRLDRNTTGLVIFGKSAQAVREINEYLRDHQVIRKYYVTILSGQLREALHLRDRTEKDTKRKMTSVLKVDAQRGSITETVVRPINTCGRFTYAEAELLTGRFHQIRAQLKNAGLPLIGDPKYGSASVNRMAKSKWNVSTQLLHAYKLDFGRCGGTLKNLSGRSVKVDLPPEFSRVYSLIFK